MRLIFRGSELLVAEGHTDFAHADTVAYMAGTGDATLVPDPGTAVAAGPGGAGGSPAGGLANGSTGGLVGAAPDGSHGQLPGSQTGGLAGELHGMVPAGGSQVIDALDFGGIHAERWPDGTPAPPGRDWVPLRRVIGAAFDESWHPAAKALSLLNWRAMHRFCGRCGVPMADKTDEMARLCPSCGAIVYPRISPAVLAAVTSNGRLLLARNAANTTGMWSILAGFVEPGETFEACVRREVAEEVGILVEPGAYHGSQPWPFPDQLMVGLSARWVSGELRPDGVEIAEAGWFGPDDHPPLPMPGSLSRRVIDATFTAIRDRLV